MSVEVSVIIPVFNGAAFVRQAYDQIQSQELRNAEIIFVNNNSTDETPLLLKEIQELDASVIVHTEHKQGAAAARNKGAKNARGEFIYFFDVDDELMPNAINHLLLILKDYPGADSVFGNAIKEKPSDFYKQVAPHVFKIKPFWGYYWFNNFSKLTGGPPAFLHRKRVFDKIGFFPESLLIGEDAAFHIKLGLHCNILQTNRTVFYYHRHEASTVSKNNKKRALIETYWEQYTKFYINYYAKEYPDPQFGVLLRQKLFLSMIRIINGKKTFQQRLKKYLELRSAIKPISIGIIIHIFFITLVFVPFQWCIRGKVKIIKYMYPDNLNLSKT